MQNLTEGYFSMNSGPDSVIMLLCFRDGLGLMLMSIFLHTKTLPSQLTAPRFGCRQIAFMTEGPAPSPEQQTMLGEILSDNPNSLKEQSKNRTHPHRNGVTTPFHEEDLLKAPLKGNHDGWGMASYCSSKSDAVEIQRSMLPAGKDDRFDATAQALTEQAPQTMLAHILNKVDPNRILTSEEDIHPFSFGNWSAMFNGVLDGGRTQTMIDAVNTVYCPALNTAPKGTNTGEKILLTFLGKLKQQFGTIDSQVLNVQKLQQTFAQTLQDFLKLSKPVYRDLDGSVAGLKGKIQLGPGCNYIVTDGKVLLAFRKGRKLYLNRHIAANGKAGYLVSSEPIQTKAQKLSWLELPQDHILTLSKATDGSIAPTLIPLTSALTSPAEAS